MQQSAQSVNMPAYHKNEILHDYFKLFMRECFKRDEKSNGIEIDIRAIEDSDLAQLIRTFISFAQSPTKPNLSIDVTGSRWSRLEINMKNVKPKMFKNFKAKLSLEDGDKNARFDEQTFLLHYSDHSSKKIIVSTSIIECIRFGEQKDGTTNSNMMMEHAEKIFVF